MFPIIIFLTSMAGLLREAARAVIQVVSGLLSMGAAALSMGYALSPLLGLHLQMKKYIEKLHNRSLAGWTKTKEILFVKGKRQILYLVPAQFINSFSASLITISITQLFSAKSLGYYSAGVRILDIPIVFITSNVSKVCYQKIGENVVKKKPVLKLLANVMASITVVSFLGFGLLYFIAPKLAEIVFGTGYSIAGVYIKCLCLMYAMRLIATSFAGVYTVFNKQNFELILNILLIAVAAVGYTLTYMLKLKITQYLWIIGIGYAFIYVLMIAGYVYICKKFDKSITPVSNVSD